MSNSTNDRLSLYDRIAVLKYALGEDGYKRYIENFMAFLNREATKHTKITLKGMEGKDNING